MEPDFYWKCFRCGECCKVSSCGFGEYDHEKKCCIHLVNDGNIDGIKLYSCAAYDTIIQDPTSKFSPAFGAGCCRNMFNEPRTKIMLKEKALHGAGSREIR